MKKIDLVCGTCLCTFQKETKEVRRQQKRGRNTFYCSLKCAGIATGTSHLQQPEVMKVAREKRNLVGSAGRCHFKELIRRAKRRGKHQGVSASELESLWIRQNGKCAMTGVQLSFDTRNPNYKASLDRIDSTVGYRADNVQFVSLTVNHAKNKHGQDVLEEFLAIVRNS